MARYSEYYKKRCQHTLNTVKALYRENPSYYAIADNLGVYPMDISRAIVDGYVSPALVKAVIPPEPRTRFTADVPAHLKEAIQAERDRLGLANNGEMLEYLWLFWKNFHGAFDD